MSIKPDERAVANPAGPREWTDEEILDSRPRLRRDVLYTQVPEGVLFHDATSGFRLHAAAAYRFTTLVTPFLNGEHRVAELCGALGEAQSRMVVGLVRSLYKRGFARDLPPADPERSSLLEAGVRRRFAAQIAYVDHHVDDAEDRFLRFRETSVAVLGDDDVARWCALSLVRNGVARVGVLGSHEALAAVEAEADDLRRDGCPATVDRIHVPSRVPSWENLATYDVVIVTPGAGEHRQLLRLLESGVPAGRALIPAWLIGDRAVVGPLMVTGEAGCWACAALRMGANGDPGQAADFWSRSLLRTAASSPMRQPSKPLAAMIGNLLGYEVFRLTTGALPAETAGKLVVQELDSLDVSVEPLLPHPHCPYCSTGNDLPDDLREGPGTRAATDVVLPSDPHEPGRPVPEPGRAEVDALLERLNRQHALIHPHAGVFTGFADEPLTQTPLRVSAIDVAVGHAERRRIAAFDVHHVVGARLAAVAAAAGVYADRVVPLPGVLTTASAESARRRMRTVGPDGLSLASGTAVGDDEVLDWVEATSLVTNRSVLVPAAAAEPFGAHNADRTCVATSAGLGVAGSAAEARGAGLLSALAYDALRHAVRGQSRLLGVALSRVDDDPVLTFLSRSARNLGIEPELVELGDAEGMPVPVLLARCPDPAGGPALWAIGAGRSWRSAAVVALRDLVGKVQLCRELSEGERLDTGDPLIAELDPVTLAVTGVVGPRLQLVTTLPQALGRLRRSGAEPLAVPIGSTDLRAGGLAVVRVLLAREIDDAA